MFFTIVQNLRSMGLSSKLGIKYPQCQGNTIEDLDHEIEEIYEILNDQIGSRDTTIEEQDKIIQEQNEVINELRGHLKKYRFSGTTNPTSA